MLTNSKSRDTCPKFAAISNFKVAGLFSSVKHFMMMWKTIDNDELTIRHDLKILLYENVAKSLIRQ